VAVAHNRRRTSTPAKAIEESLVAEKYAHKLIRTLRIRLDDRPGTFADVSTAIGRRGGLLGDIRRVAIDSHSVVREVTLYVDSVGHLDEILGDVAKLSGITVERVTDDVLELHRGGKLRLAAIPEIRTLQDLQMIYTPGVAGVCNHIVAHPEDFRRYTWVGNTVAIVTDGSAVLGLGNIGPRAALPVMEGKAVILNRFVGVGCVPILLDTQDADTIVETVQRIAPTFGIIMLEDIAAPKCFEIEARLASALPIPVFHDDQHGTAVVVLATITNALSQANLELGRLRVVILGSGAAGATTARLLLAAGACDVTLCDRAGAIYAGRPEGMDDAKARIAAITNPQRRQGKPADVLRGAHVLIGLSSKGIVSAEMVGSMAPPRIVLALANPDPEISLREAVAAGAGVALDGRTVNNALAFPGIIRGTLDSGARAVTETMKLAAAKAIAGQATEGLLLPSILDAAAHAAVAEAVAQAWRSGKASTRDQPRGRTRAKE
jgi:malate dehydrogenase (oxaloacetate-decarboxylating)